MTVSNRLVIIGYVPAGIYITGYLTNLQVGYLHVESSQVRCNRLRFLFTLSLFHLVKLSAHMKILLNK